MSTPNERAMSLLNSALREGLLERPDECELCNSTPGKGTIGQSLIVAHHWDGYHNPLDIWWICTSCNYYLRGKHDGSLNKEQARAYIEQRKIDPPPVVKKWWTSATREQKANFISRWINNKE